jgi:hypothetical protein
VSQHDHRDVQPETIARHSYQQYGGAPQENLDGRTAKVTCGVVLHRNPLLMVKQRLSLVPIRSRESLLLRSRRSRGQSSR